MKLLTRRIMAAEAPERFKKNYFIQGKWNDASWHLPRHKGLSAEKIYRLLAEHVEPSPEVVAELINESWVRVPTCDDCGRRDCESIMQLGQEPDYESATANVCLDCLRKALQLMEGQS